MSTEWTAQPQAGQNGPGTTVQGMYRLMRLYFERPAVAMSPYLAEDAAMVWSNPITGERRILVGPGSTDRIEHLELALDEIYGPRQNGSKS